MKTANATKHRAWAKTAEISFKTFIVSSQSKGWGTGVLNTHSTEDSGPRPWWCYPEEGRTASADDAVDHSAQTLQWRVRGFTRGPSVVTSRKDPHKSLLVAVAGKGPLPKETINCCCFKTLRKGATLNIPLPPAPRGVPGHLHL